MGNLTTGGRSGGGGGAPRGGNLPPGGGGGGGGDSQMGYIMCCFIGYGVKAAKSRTGYRNQRATLG